MMQILRPLAYFFSVIFHPLLLLSYLLLLLLLVNPYLFGVQSPSELTIVIFRIFVSSFLIPVIAILLLRNLGLVKSLHMETKQDRIGPYIVCGTFYLWLFINLLYNSSIPRIYTAFVLGSVIALFTAFLINLVSKISLHGIGAGGLVAASLIICFRYSYPSFDVALPFAAFHFSTDVIIIVSIILAGIIGTSRLILKAHSPKELYMGFGLGFATQFLALNILT